jgi:hypothetical protein
MATTSARPPVSRQLAYLPLEEASVIKLHPDILLAGKVHIKTMLADVLPGEIDPGLWHSGETTHCHQRVEITLPKRLRVSMASIDRADDRFYWSWSYLSIVGLPELPAYRLALVARGLIMTTRNV